eukprot:scaffold6551_cov77-Skeletonema_marinoi.AAC.1
MQYDDVCDLLHSRPSSALEIVGRKLRELHNEFGSNKFGIALSHAKKHVLYWFESTSVPSLDGIDQSNVSAEKALEAIVDGQVVRVRVTQDTSLECTDIPDRTKRNGLTDDDKHKIAQVIESAASLPHCEKTQRGCFSAIRKYIAIPNKELPSLTSHNMLTNAIVVGMKAHPERCNIQADALSTLSQMVWSLPAAAKQMVNEGGCLQLAIDAMEIHASHSKTQQSACELFVALSYDKTCCQVMLDSDVISSVLNSIKGCLKKFQPKALASGLLFLQNMSVISLDNVAKAILSEEHVLSTLLRTIQTKTSNTNLLISLFGLLSNLALHTDVRSRIADAGGVEIIQDRLASILKTLLNLALNTAVAKTLAENYCAYEVVAHAHARASRDNPDLLFISLGLLDKLIDTEVAANQNEVASDNAYKYNTIFENNTMEVFQDTSNSLVYCPSRLLVGLGDTFSTTPSFLLSPQLFFIACSIQAVKQDAKQHSMPRQLQARLSLSFASPIFPFDDACFASINITDAGACNSGHDAAFVEIEEEFDRNFESCQSGFCASLDYAPSEGPMGMCSCGIVFCSNAAYRAPTVCDEGEEYLLSLAQLVKCTADAAKDASQKRKDVISVNNEASPKEGRDASQSCQED